MQADRQASAAAVAKRNEAEPRLITSASALMQIDLALLGALCAALGSAGAPVAEHADYRSDATKHEATDPSEGAGVRQSGTTERYHARRGNRYSA
jgi:hypothetical protein